MDIYNDEPFKRNVFDLLSLIKNTLDNFTFTAHRVEITSDEFFTRTKNIKTDNDLMSVLGWLKNNKIILGNSVEKDKLFSGDFGDYKSDLYIFDVDSSKLNKFLENTRKEINFVKFSELKENLLTRNGITLDLKDGSLSHEKQKIDININKKPIVLLAILMANSGLINFSEIYQELDVTPEENEKGIMNGNLRKIKSELVDLLKQIGFNDSETKMMIQTRNKIGLIMKEIK